MNNNDILIVTRFLNNNEKSHKVSHNNNFSIKGNKRNNPVKKIKGLKNTSNIIIILIMTKIIFLIIQLYLINKN